MDNQLFIPDKLKVGFCKRNDTYTGKLAYVIYFDKQGVLRKEKSWEGWRDKNIKPIEYENTPCEGFVLNKDVGGTRHSYGWDARMEKVRVYDPRDFEFEITIPNMLFILQHCDSNKGKGLTGKFVYAWSSSQLVLLPVDCEEYRQCLEYSDLQGKGVKATEMVPGATYTTKKQKQMVYLGRFDRHFLVKCDIKWEPNKQAEAAGKKKVHVFWSAEGKKKGTFYYLQDLKTIGQIVSSETHPEFSNLVEKYNKSAFGSPAVSILLKPGEEVKYMHQYKRGSEPYERNENYWAYEESPGIFVVCEDQTGHSRYDHVTKKCDGQPFTTIMGRVQIKDGKVLYATRSYGHDVMVPPGSTYAFRSYGGQGFGYRIPPYETPTRQLNWVEHPKLRLWLKREDGTTKRLILGELERE
jgi:hypothetical protein